MKKRLVIIGILAVLVCVELSGCNNTSPSYTTEKNKFVGTWIWIYPSGNGSFKYSFFSNGTFTFNRTGLKANGTGTFDVKDGKLFLTFNVNNSKNIIDLTYMFSENNTKLSLNGTPYTKNRGIT